MENKRTVNRIQIAALAIVISVFLVFTLLYAVLSSKQGFLYCGSILVPEQNEGYTVYQGKIDRIPTSFSVYESGSITYRYGDIQYGPYSFELDSNAVPQGTGLSNNLTGIVIRNGDKLIFRGAYMKYQGDSLDLIVYDSSGKLMTTVLYSIKADEKTPESEPDFYTLIDLASGPRLTHRGNWSVWACASLFCAAACFMIYYADELFRHKVSMRIRNAENIEPSELELTERYASWVIMIIAIVIFYYIGLKPSL